MPSHGYLFAGSFGVEIHHNDFGFDSSKQIICGVERVVGRVHEYAAHQVNNCILDAALRYSFEYAVSGQAGHHVDGAKHTAGAVLATGGGRVEILRQFSLVPHVITGSENVRTEVE